MNIFISQWIYIYLYIGVYINFSVFHLSIKELSTHFYKFQCNECSFSIITYKCLSFRKFKFTIGAGKNILHRPSILHICSTTFQSPNNIAVWKSYITHGVQSCPFLYGSSLLLCSNYMPVMIVCLIPSRCLKTAFDYVVGLPQASSPHLDTLRQDGRPMKRVIKSYLDHAEEWWRKLGCGTFIN